MNKLFFKAKMYLQILFLKRKIQKILKNPNELSYIGKDANITIGVINTKLLHKCE